jgi:hypothetical protein
MDQHIPSVDRADVERVVARDFPPELRSQILQALSAYGTESYQRESHRVHLDILKLAGGDLARVIQETENAGCDYRDTILSAEYPNYGRKMFHIDDLPPLERDRIIEADKQQYEVWLHRRETQGEQDGTSNGG